MPPCNRADRGCNITLLVTVQTSVWSHVARKSAEPSQEDKQMMVGNPTDAASGLTKLEGCG